jgi:hypothetical protein
MYPHRVRSFAKYQGGSRFCSFEAAKPAPTLIRASLHAGIEAQWSKHHKLMALLVEARLFGGPRADIAWRRDEY